MAYDNTNRGTIAKNARKTEDSHPDISGTINVGGVEYWLNGWAKKNSKDGSSFYSLTVKPKQEKAAPKREQRSSYDDRDDPRSRRNPSGGYPDDDGEIPF